MKKELTKILSYTKPVDTCLEWVRCFNTDGYPRAVFDGNSNGKVHRVVFELSTGTSAEGLIVRHKCDNIRCVNPDHLEVGTTADNMRDRDTRLRHGAAKLTPNKVKCIRSLRGIVPQKYIAEMFGINSRTVSSIQLKRHWKWLT